MKEHKLLHNESFTIIVIVFVTTLLLVISIGMAVIFSKDKRPNPNNRKEYCEYALKERYGKDFTVDKIYGGDYSGVYYAEAHANDNPNLIFTVSTNRKSDSLDDFTDNYLERSQEEVYRKEFDEFFAKNDVEYYAEISVRNKNFGDYENPIFKVYFETLYVSSSWLTESNDEIWAEAHVIAEKYDNYRLIFVTDEDLQKIKDEFQLSDEMSNDLNRYLNDRYSIESDRGETHRGDVIISTDNYDDFIDVIEQIRKNELFR